MMWVMKRLWRLPDSYKLPLRGSDVIGRFGGDEFAVIMSGTPAESAITAMLRVHEGAKHVTLAEYATGNFTD